jgi:hypothetical protein
MDFPEWLQRAEYPASGPFFDYWGGTGGVLADGEHPLPAGAPE